MNGGAKRKGGPGAVGKRRKHEARGRPTAAPEEKTQPFSVRLNADERALVHRAASLCMGERWCAATWARIALVEAARKKLEE